MDFQDHLKSFYFDACGFGLLTWVIASAVTIARRSRPEAAGTAFATA